MQQEDQGIVI